MPLAQDYSEQLLGIVNKIFEDWDRLKKKEREMTKEFDRLYHSLEVAPPFNVVQGYKYAKTLQQLLQRRRVIKHEIYALNNFIGMSQIRGLLKTMPRVIKGVEKIEKKNEQYRKNFTVSSKNVLLEELGKKAEQLEIIEKEMREMEEKLEEKLA